MLGYYIKSTIVFLIIYFASSRVIKTLLHNRDEIDYKKYTKKDHKRNVLHILLYTSCESNSVISNVLVNSSF